MKRLFTILETGLQFGEVWKAPVEEFDVTFDWSRLLAGDTISSATWTLPEGWTAPEVAEIDATETKTIARIGGGSAGTLGALVCTIVTADGATFEAHCLAHVREAAA
jgi:hypothetical protein